MFNTLLVYPMFNFLAVIYAAIPFHDFGIAIIIFTAVVRFALWPLVAKQLHSQRAIQKLQPEMVRIRKEAAGDRQLEGRLTMELYKEKGVNPFAAFLPLLIQLPIFFALFVVLRDVVKPGEIARLAYGGVKSLEPIAAAIANRNFHPELFGIVDLAQPNLVLAIMAGALQFLQTKQLQPKHPSDDPQAKVLATMIYVFPFITIFVGLTLPSALALYWITTSAIAILQQTLTLRRDVDELEEAVVVPAETGEVSKTKAKRKARAEGKR